MSYASSASPVQMGLHYKLDIVYTLNTGITQLLTVLVRKTGTSSFNYTADLSYNCRLNGKQSRPDQMLQNAAPDLVYTVCSENLRVNMVIRKHKVSFSTTVNHSLCL